MPCDREHHIKHTLTPEYYSCYTVSIDKETYNNYTEQNKWIMGVDVTLFLNNRLDDISLPYQRNAFRGQASGAMISETIF